MLTPLVEVVKVIANPAAAQALYDLSDAARRGADVIERLGDQLARAARNAAVAPVPPQPENIPLGRVVTLGELLQIAQDEGRVVYAP